MDFEVFQALSSFKWYYLHADELKGDTTFLVVNLAVTVPEDSKGLWKIIELGSRALSVVIWVQPGDQKELDDSLISEEQTFMAQNH